MPNYFDPDGTQQGKFDAGVAQDDAERKARSAALLKQQQEEAARINAQVMANGGPGHGVSGYASQPSAPPPQAMSDGGGSSAPPTGATNVAAPSASMASLMNQPPAPLPNDVSMTGPGGTRQGLGTRNPPQYNYALASLSRGVY